MKIKSIEKFEYMFFRPGEYAFKQNMVDELNKLGADGWEAVTMVDKSVLMKKKYIIENIQEI